MHMQSTLSGGIRSTRKVKMKRSYLAFSMMKIREGLQRLHTSSFFWVSYILILFLPNCSRFMGNTKHHWNDSIFIDWDVRFYGKYLWLQHCATYKQCPLMNFLPISRWKDWSLRIRQEENSGSKRQSMGKIGICSRWRRYVTFPSSFHCILLSAKVAHCCSK